MGVSTFFTYALERYAPKGFSEDETIHLATVAERDIAQSLKPSNLADAYVATFSKSKSADGYDKDFFETKVIEAAKSRQANLCLHKLEAYFAENASRLPTELKSVDTLSFYKSQSYKTIGFYYLDGTEGKNDDAASKKMKAILGVEHQKTPIGFE